MNIAIDIGNTTTKAGLFEGHTLKEKITLTNENEILSFSKSIVADNVILSSVGERMGSILSLFHARGKKILLTPELFLPIRNLYSTPATLGVDRIAAACGAWHLYPDQPTLVIDTGTCINYEFTTGRGEYMGGAISPGLKMRFESMHHYTAKLPVAHPVKNAPLTGDSTITCLQSGVMNGITEEINGTIARYKTMHPGLKVLLCGGDSHFFENTLNHPIFVAPELVLMGLNSILLNNVEV